MIGRAAWAAGIVLLVVLAGCGKKSAPVAPGPTDQIIFPHPYPDPARAQD